MEPMNHSFLPNAKTGEVAIDAATLSLLSRLPSEQGNPSSESDIHIRRAAAAKMAAIRRRARLRWVSGTIAAMAACLLLAMFINRQDTPDETRIVDLARDDAAIILREVSALFPGQVRAIHRDAAGLHLTLSEAPDVDSSMAVVIEIGHDGGSFEIITFNGQTIELMGRNVTVHADPNRGILLNGHEIEKWNTRHDSHLTIRPLSI